MNEIECIETALDIYSILSVLDDDKKNNIFGYNNTESIVKNNTLSSILDKWLKYEKLKPEKDELNIGDVVILSLCVGVVTRVIENTDGSKEYTVLFTNGVSDTYKRYWLRKTGKNINILQGLRKLIL